MRVWRLTTGSIFIRSGIKGCVSLKTQSVEALVRQREAEQNGVEGSRGAAAR